MKSQVSPFAALTGAEKQLKWLEYQSIRLPYTRKRRSRSRKLLLLLPLKLHRKHPKSRLFPIGHSRRNRRREFPSHLALIRIFKRRDTSNMMPSLQG